MMIKRILRITILLIVLVLDILLIKRVLFGKVSIVLNGSEEETINVFDTYSEEGSNIYFDGRKIKNKLYKSHVDSNVNTNVVGTYNVTYNYTFRKKEFKKQRTVNVVDTIKPVIKVASKEVYKYNSSFSRVYYTASDNYDGDLTKKVTVDFKDTEVTLSVVDSSNNKEELTLPVKEVEVEPLTLKLNGSPVYYVEANTSYSEKGVSVSNKDKELKDYPYTIDSNLDLSKEGTYEIIYTVDYYGVKSSIFRSIHVYNKKETPKIERETGLEKVVYLTFDDGPGVYTEEILNVLSEYDAKATFFVTDQFSGKYINLIKKEYDLGHKIAVHTNTHKYSIYSSPEDYINDFNTINKKIEDLTGEKTKLFRFPGGSSNTISRSYCNGIMKYLANLMESNGYVYFDWNVDSTDAAGSGAEKIFNSVVDNVRKHKESVVLMHDIHKSTLEALPKILETLKAEGYEFRVLNENSYTSHHGINN